MRPPAFRDTAAMVYVPSARSWRWSHRCVGAIFVLVVFGLACGAFEPEFWR